MTDLEKYKAFCISFGEALKEYTNEAIKRNQNSNKTNNKEFNTGYLNGFHRVITLMQQQAEVYEIPFENLGIDFSENDLILP